MRVERPSVVNTDGEDARPVFPLRQVRAVAALARAALRAAEVEVDRVDVRLHKQRRCDERRRVVPAKLHDERPIRRCRASRTRSTHAFRIDIVERISDGGMTLANAYRSACAPV